MLGLAYIRFSNNNLYYVTWCNTWSREGCQVVYFVASWGYFLGMCPDLVDCCSQVSHSQNVSCVLMEKILLGGTRHIWDGTENVVEDAEERLNKMLPYIFGIYKVKLFSCVILIIFLYFCL